MANQLGYALGGGGARGFGHIGFLDEMHHHWKPYAIAGTSMGAVIATLYAKKLDPDWVKQVAHDFSKRGFRFWRDVSRHKGGFLRGAHIERFLREYLKDTRFSDLQIPVAVVTTDLENGQAVVIRDGEVVPALRASISIPGLFVPVSYQMHERSFYLVDGGISTPMPVAPLREMGCDVVVAVSANPTYALVDTDPRNLDAAEIVMRSFYLMQRSIMMRRLQADDVLVELDLGNSRFLDFTRVDYLVEQGREAARNSFAKIYERLEAFPNKLARTIKKFTRETLGTKPPLPD